MASVREMLNFLKSRGVVIDKLIEKNEVQNAYKSAFSEEGQARHRYICKIGNLLCLVKTNSAEPDNIFVAIHGFGANKEDLEDICDMFFNAFVDLRCAFIFPEASVRLTPQVESFGWWMIDVQELGRKMLNMKFDQIINDHPQGLEEARASLLCLLDEAANKFHVNLKNFILFGFSQGSMLCLDLLLHMNTLPLYVGLFSCGPMMQGEYRALLHSMEEKRKNEILKTPIFQTHGTSDIIIPVIGGELVQQFLHSEKFNNEYKVFDGGHSFPSSSLTSYFFFKVATKIREMKQA